MHALEVNAQAFSSREYNLSWRLHALGVRQLSYYRMLIKQALVLKTQALLLESFKHALVANTQLLRQSASSVRLRWIYELLSFRECFSSRLCSKQTFEFLRCFKMRLWGIHKLCPSRCVSAQVFSSQMYFKHTLVLKEQIFSSREWTKHALGCKCTAVSSQEFKECACG